MAAGDRLCGAGNVVAAIPDGRGGKAGNSVIAALGTLMLGTALAVVLVLYVRVTDQMKEQNKSVHKESEKDILPEPVTRSHEEIYESFLKATEERELSNGN